ncbi:LLM class flavin-dependent oxidoreductase [Staphylococcus saprophyticus]|uniref:Putative monooxygenase n=1 Tax=Staphylococcus saprophyticus subsp. saprophyticus (strain ATCC 15305 / DSM 20229 / NCIMB 8711 / NCTC 7292 / S-41) TaxID=342451 RepID=Q49X22_STAS1|nr:LLM class flavin-dependent oxidoreductase [Staphylococcus saprophyticus]ASF18355.1 LLM class flavin-dependent oxidoreductase [Staphylococcus saprophyticus]MDW3918009.1 LLM class flavin-dependent oxidoreductase [Staphylococcus saprophyticus]OOC98362.1 monooxygenase [Staphylococcus saprophyticus subsp. saprophyticus ATCC 15305 = NCTC 7292]QCY42747.1 LLM class flavin-dependent oxidoreductase [Staphylococcus saprophyticus subsp. saprophyticus ATCC 15305 = NCTC 7292]RTX66500.1 LLM class flavin-d
MTQSQHLSIGVLIYACGHHQAAWRMPHSSIERIGDITYYQSLARTAEQGLFDAIFFADNQSFPASSKSDMPAFWFDPLVNLAAISQVTQHVGLVATISSTFSNPFTAARQLLSLDHMSQGRAGWNLVTSMTDMEAANHSMDHLPEHEERYKKADEFAQVMNRLLESWSLDDFLHDKEDNKLINPSAINAINHEGEHFNVRGPLTTPSSPQGKPIAMQAGASDPGIALATKYADAVYAVAWNFNQASAFKNKLNQKLIQEGKPKDSLKVFPGLVAYVGQTYEEAYAKKQKLDESLEVDTALNQLAFFIRQNCHSWDLDEPVPPLPPVESFKGPKGRYQTVLEIIKDKNPTLRELLGYLSAGGGHLTLIGTPKDIVDEMERWFDAGVADGFNLMPPEFPNSLEDFVDDVVPELQKRGLYRTEYEGTTFRENIGI